MLDNVESEDFEHVMLKTFYIVDMKITVLLLRALFPCLILKSVLFCLSVNLSVNCIIVDEETITC